MFLARLDDAGGQVDSEISKKLLKKVILNDDLKTSGDQGNYNEKASLSPGIASSKESADDNETILLEKCCEYLFDLFDANLTPGYRRINLIQEKAIKCFGSTLVDERSCNATNGKMIEYTFEQQHLHQEFKDLFEVLISDFLYDEKISIDDFHSILRKTSASSSTAGRAKKKNQKAKFTDEILDCVMWYTDFESWAEFMTAEAKCRRNLGNLEICGAFGAKADNLDEESHCRNIDHSDGKQPYRNQGNNDDKSHIECNPKISSYHKCSEFLL